MSGGSKPRSRLLLLGCLLAVGGCPMLHADDGGPVSTSDDAGPDAGVIDAGQAPDGGDPGADDGGAAADAGAEKVDDGGAAEAGLPDGSARDAGADDAGSLVDAGPSDAAAAEAYCACVFVACHDDFHETFGEDDLASLEACHAAAVLMPRTGAPALVGDSLECRQYWCEAQPADCPSALGLNATCTDG